MQALRTLRLLVRATALVAFAVLGESHLAGKKVVRAFAAESERHGERAAELSREEP
jgi:hypothetical protein